MTEQPSNQPPLPSDSVESLEEEWRRVLIESQQPFDENLPTQSLASPAHLKHPTGESIDWWHPSWRDAARHVGWRWFLLIPGVLLTGLVLFSIFWHGWRDPFLVIEIKLLTVLAAAALSLAGYVIRRASRATNEPFCIFCGYQLTGLPDNYRCPECGRPYTWRLIGEYRRDPRWFIERYQAFRRLPPPVQPFEAGSVRRKSRDGT